MASKKNNSGWIPLSRRLQNNFLWKRRRVFSKAEAWIDILFSVQYKPTPEKMLFGNTILYCHRGQSLKSQETWAERWSWTRAKVRRFFDLLKTEGMIETKNEIVTTRLSVVNYESYNNQRPANGQGVVKKPAQLSPCGDTEYNNQRPANGQQTDTDKKDNNVYNYIEQFDTFWEIYPKKVDKKDARGVWNRLKPNEQLFKKIIKAVERQRQTEQWQTRKYIPSPRKWLRNEKWDDEIDEVPVSSNSGILDLRSPTEEEVKLAQAAWDKGGI